MPLSHWTTAVETIVWQCTKKAKIKYCIKKAADRHQELPSIGDPSNVTEMEQINRILKVRVSLDIAFKYSIMLTDHLASWCQAKFILYSCFWYAGGVTILLWRLYRCLILSRQNYLWDTLKLYLLNIFFGGLCI